MSEQHRYEWKPDTFVPTGGPWRKGDHAGRVFLLTADRANALEQSAVVLRSLEWSGEYGMCPTCDQVNAMGHSPDCPIGGALAALDAAEGGAE